MQESGEKLSEYLGRFKGGEKAEKKPRHMTYKEFKAKRKKDEK